jgi:hypothetical protein
MSKSYTQEEVQARAERILSMPAGLKYGTINEFRDMANGESAYGIREEYYPGMPDQFFIDVLAAIARGVK